MVKILEETNRISFGKLARRVPKLRYVSEIEERRLATRTSHPAFEEVNPISGRFGDFFWFRTWVLGPHLAQPVKKRGPRDFIDV